MIADPGRQVSAVATLPASRPPTAAPSPFVPVEVVPAPLRRQHQRLAFVDNLRIFLIALVVAHHAGQAYGPTGGAWPIFEPERIAILGPFFATNAAFFMGLFFFVSACFVPGAFARRGAGAFLRERSVRLGVPLVFVGAAVFGPLTYVMYAAETPQPVGFWQYLVRVYPPHFEVAHLWFLAHLLGYALLFAAGATLWRRRRASGGSGATSATRSTAPIGWVPGHRAILGYFLALAAVTFVVRLFFDIDRWVRLFGVVPVEMAHLPQYASLYALGLVAARPAWLARLPARVGYVWLGLGLTGVALRYAVTVFQVPLDLPGGGLRLDSLLWCTWEAAIAVGLTVGLLTLFRERADRQGRLLRLLSRDVYGVYLVHLFVVWGVQAALLGIALPPVAKFGVAALAGLPLSFLVADGLRRLPGLRAIL